MSNFWKIFFLATVCFSSPVLFAQRNNIANLNELFTKIEEGFQTGNIDKFSNHFNNKTYISLFNGVNGYYSSNQSYYVLKDFLAINQPINFKLDNIVTDSSTPFASGIFRYKTNGISNTSLIFISIKNINNEWRINQITIN
ncbi:DUF4783 domain-containing protein [Melioribacteraceae bacterium 4301-Me]|uniref:DUF4783 domain-containing protein n=1 Tax=Pyranulibacter aquaticus TaxID=3163344 RepID=UPI003599E4FD